MTVVVEVVILGRLVPVNNISRLRITNDYFFLQNSSVLFRALGICNLTKFDLAT